MFKARQTLDKYRIERRLADGGFAAVFRAYDTIEGIPVALKVPHQAFITDEVLEDFRKEVRVTASLDHPNILPIKNASFIGDRFIIVYALGEGTLTDRLRRRLGVRAALHYAEQILEAVSHAHQRGIIHCDIKPDNLILFPGDRIRLTDFGIAKVALHTQAFSASGTGTLGYLAPEQAFGKPSFRSDVFAAGLVLYRMFSGVLPQWPYTWPPPGLDRLRRLVHGDFVAFFRRAMAVDDRKRFRDATQQLEAFRPLKTRTLRAAARRRRATKGPEVDWKTVRIRAFRRRFGRTLETRGQCARCNAPIAETMRHCPWCGSHRRVYRGTTTFPGRCKRCGRGVKRDWKYCAWCYGPSIQVPSSRDYPDRRYTARCQNPACQRRQLMPYMRYCPWCRAKVQRSWKVEGSTDRCVRCDWGVVSEYWSYCPWCDRKLEGG
jgi:serine/threonine-protein kinase